MHLHCAKVENFFDYSLIQITQIQLIKSPPESDIGASLVFLIKTRMLRSIVSHRTLREFVLAQ